MFVIPSIHCHSPRVKHISPLEAHGLHSTSSSCLCVQRLCSHLGVSQPCLCVCLSRLQLALLPAEERQDGMVDPQMTSAAAEKSSEGAVSPGRSQPAGRQVGTGRGKMGQTLSWTGDVACVLRPPEKQELMGWLVRKNVSPLSRVKP